MATRVGLGVPEPRFGKRKQKLPLWELHVYSRTRSLSPQKTQGGLTEIFHDLMMSLKCSIKIFLKIYYKWKTSVLLVSLIVPAVSHPLCIVTGKVGSQLQGSGALCTPVRSLCGSVLVARGKLLGVRWGGLREGDLATVTEERWGCPILGLWRKGEACRVVWETSLGPQIGDNAFCKVQFCSSSHPYHLVT